MSGTSPAMTPCVSKLSSKSGLNHRRPYPALARAVTGSPPVAASATTALVGSCVIRDDRLIEIDRAVPFDQVLRRVEKAALAQLQFQQMSPLGFKAATFRIGRTPLAKAPSAATLLVSTDAAIPNPMREHAGDAQDIGRQDQSPSSCAHCAAGRRRYRAIRRACRAPAP